VKILLPFCQNNFILKVVPQARRPIGSHPKLPMLAVDSVLKQPIVTLKLLSIVFADIINILLIRLPLALCRPCLLLPCKTCFYQKSKHTFFNSNSSHSRTSNSSVFLKAHVVFNISIQLFFPKSKQNANVIHNVSVWKYTDMNLGRYCLTSTLHNSGSFSVIQKIFFKFCYGGRRGCGFNYRALMKL